MGEAEREIAAAQAEQQRQIQEQQRRVRELMERQERMLRNAVDHYVVEARRRDGNK